MIDRLPKTILGLILLLLAILGFLSPIIYDDIGYAMSSYSKLGMIEYINTVFIQSFDYSLEAYLYLHGRPGTPMHTFFIHLPILWGIFTALVFMILYIFIPFIMYYKRIPNKKEDYRFILFSMAIMLGYSLLFPHQAWILNDFFLRTIANGFIVPMAFFLLLLIPIWQFYINHSLLVGCKQLDDFRYKNALFFIVAFFACVHNEFSALYGIGAVIGIVILSIIKEKRVKIDVKIPSHLWSLYAGLLIGGGITIFAPGVMVRKETSSILDIINIIGMGTLKLIYRELHYALIPLLTTLAIVIVLVLLISKYNESLREQVKQKIWISLYCFCCFLGWGLIVFLSALPYIRVLIIGQGVLPLLYLLILWLWVLIEYLPRVFLKYIISLCSLFIVVLSFSNAWHNIRVMTAIQWKLKEDIAIAQEKNIPLVVRPYKVVFKNAYYKKNGEYIDTSEWHGFDGTPEFAQKYGERLLFHIPTIETYRGSEGWSPLVSILSLYRFTGEVDIEKSQEAEQRVIDKYPTFLEILVERSKSIL